MTTTTPPPSSLRRSVELDAVRDVMLLESDAQRRTEPIPRQAGGPALRGTIEGQLNNAIAAEDTAAEHQHSIALAKLHFERDLDLDRAVQLLHRALEIEDDAVERRELARQLRMMGRHIESGHVLRDGQPAEQAEVADAWLHSGDAYARAGETYEAIATYREVAMLAPDDPRPFERIAALAHWDAESVPAQRAADAMIEAAKRHPQHTAAATLAVARAFEVAPSYARSAEVFTRVLREQNRDAAADEVWREYGDASHHVQQVAERRAAWSRQRERWVMVLAATLDHCIDAGRSQEGREGPLGELLGDEVCLSALKQHVTDEQPFSAGLLAAARTRSSMGRAEAFAKLARRFRGELRSLLLSYAAEAFAAAGNAPRAHSMAHRAVATAPWLPRAHAAMVAIATDDGPDGSELEAAAGRLPIRSRLLNIWADRLAAGGQHALALVVVTHLLALRQGDPQVVARLIEHGLASRDQAVVQRALVDALATVVPWKQVAPTLSNALAEVAQWDPRLARQVAGAVLDVIGPGDERLYGVLRDTARAVGDTGMDAALVLRRAVGDDVADDGRAALYLEAVEMCLARGDPESAAEHLYCAAAHGGPLERLSHLIEVVGDAIAGLPAAPLADAQLALAHAAAWAAEQRDSLAAGEAWRQLGAMRWDLAGDEVGADEAFFVACAHDPDSGPYRYATDLEDRAGAEHAVALLVDRAVAIGDEGDDPGMCGRLYAAAARVAADVGLHELALNTAVAAVQADPARGDAVALVEKIARGEEGLVALEFVYDTLANAALGRYGFRAAHYRAARQLEKRGALESALRHAIVAFEAVPSVGASYKMLLRIASRAGDEGAAVRTLAGVAASFPSETEIAWLMRAADLARQFSGAEELRFDLLLKAFKLRQTPDLATRLAASARDLASGASDETVVHLRLERAIIEALPALAGSKGADTAIVLASAAVVPLGSPELAVTAVSRAIEIDAFEADYAMLLPHIEAIAAQREVARTLLERINELRRDRAASLPRGLKDLTSQLYLLLSDLPPAPASISAAESEPPALTSSPLPPASTRRPSEPVVVAVHEDVELDDAMLEAALVESMGGRQRESGTRADRWGGGARASSTDPRRSTAAADDAAGVDRGRHARTPGAREARLADAVEVLASEDALEQVEYVERDGRLVASVVPPPRRDLAPGGESRGAPPRHGELDEAIAAAEQDAARAQVAEDLRHSSRPPADDETYAFEPVERTTPTSDKPPAQLAGAYPLLAAVDFSPASEQRARQRGDHEAIAAMLSARAEATPNVTQRRLVRLRRAAVLEQRLDRLEDACAELELILEESGEDATALRYLADLYGRIDRPTRAARMWLRASKQATRLDEKLRDVIRCCEALVLARRPETAKRLLDAASGLPQSPRLLRLRAAVARQLGDAELAATVEAELASLGPPDEGGSVPPSESLGALASSPPTQPPPPPSVDDDATTRVAAVRVPAAAHTPRESNLPSTETISGRNRERPVSSRRVFRLSPSALAEGDPDKVLERCRQSFLEGGAGDAKEARETVRALRTIAEYLDDEARDLHTFLLVQALQIVRGPAAAMAELQHHWEARGGTPLVALAVADHLGRRGELRPALQLYERNLGRPLHGIRGPGQLSLDAADLARRIGDRSAMERHLDRALGYYESAAGAQQRYLEWFGRSVGAPPGADGSAPPAAGGGTDFSDSDRVADTPPPRESLDDIELDDTGSVAGPAPAAERPAAIPSSPPSALSLVRRPPTFPEFVGPQEEDLFDEMINGSYEAGDSLVALYAQDRTPRHHDVLAVRRYQATLRRGDKKALVNLRAAAVADGAAALARAVAHALGAFDPGFRPLGPPPLERLAHHPDATTKLLFAPLKGTVNEALAVAWQSGLMQQEPSAYNLSGTDRVAPVATTSVGRTYASLSRLLDLHGARLFHRSRKSGGFEATLALTSPASAVLSGRLGQNSAAMRFRVGSALACTRPELALVEGLDEPDARNLIRALIAGFGPVEDRSVTEASIEQMRIAEDLWHLVTSAAERRLRALCRNRREMSYEVAHANAKSTRRRAGLFAAGDFRVAVGHCLTELDEALPRKRREGQLRDLCNLPEVADLYDLAILPEYAMARWTAG